MSQRTLSRSQKKAVEEGKLVETINSLDYTTYKSRFLKSNDLTAASRGISVCIDRTVQIEFLFPELLKDNDGHIIDACFALIQNSSAAAYKSSEMKWSPSNKRKEMVLPDMRYLIISEENSASTPCTDECSRDAETTTRPVVLGFISFMITYEDGYEVLYVYEVHLSENLRGQGVGTVLMDIVEEIGRSAGVEKCMLTVFRSNRGAVRWYERRGYILDDFSPGPRTLRNGMLKQPTYLILSKVYHG